MISFGGEKIDLNLYSTLIADKSRDNVYFCVCVVFNLIFNFLVQKKKTFIWETQTLCKFDSFHMAICLASRSLAQPILCLLNISLCFCVSRAHF